MRKYPVGHTGKLKIVGVYQTSKYLHILYTFELWSSRQLTGDATRSTAIFHKRQPQSESCYVLLFASLHKSESKAGTFMMRAEWLRCSPLTRGCSGHWENGASFSNSQCAPIPHEGVPFILTQYVLPHHNNFQLTIRSKLSLQLCMFQLTRVDFSPMLWIVVYCFRCQFTVVGFSRYGT